jgi:hypothetical protein
MHSVRIIECTSAVADVPVILRSIDSLSTKEEATIQMTQHSAARFSKDFMYARELADAAWDAERTAWEQLADNRMPVKLWWEIRQEALQAQKFFDRLVTQYWHDNGIA